MEASGTGVSVSAARNPVNWAVPTALFRAFSRHPARGVHPLRRPPRASTPRARPGGGAVHVAAAARPVRLGPLPPPERAALGAGGSVAVAGRGANGPTSGGARASGSPHLRALVHARRPAVAASLPRGRARAVRAPPAPGSRIHDRGRGGP